MKVCRMAYKYQSKELQTNKHSLNDNIYKHQIIGSMTKAQRGMAISSMLCRRIDRGERRGQGLTE